ncbi:MAG: hypothetical protein CGW95_03690 [Phenylobacterium zucineum]|nr:MAG: hypothetical protein CGW95_03690 [Phenylobacterium zucineum]
MQIGGLLARPYLLMVSTLVAYQVLLKLPRPGRNILAVQTFAYAVAPAISYFAFRETLPSIDLAGLAVCPAGLWLASL